MTTIRLAAENTHVDQAAAMRRRIEKALANGDPVTVDLRDAALSAAYVRDALAPPLAAYGPDRLTLHYDNEGHCFAKLANRYARDLSDPNDPKDAIEHTDKLPEPDRTFQDKTSTTPRQEQHAIATRQTV